MSEKRKKTPEVQPINGAPDVPANKRHKSIIPDKNCIVYNGTSIPFPKPKPKQNTYCICRKEDNGELMVGCDSCDDWYHFHCLKLDPSLQKLYYKFYCPYCELQNPESNISIFKKKCMLAKCFSPIAKNSKFCSRDHGLQYFHNIKSKLACNSSLNLVENLQQILAIPNLHFPSFRSLGLSLPDPSLTVMATSFQQFVKLNHEYNTESSNLLTMIQKNQIKINYIVFKMHVVNDLILLKNSVINSHVNAIILQCSSNNQKQQSSPTPTEIDSDSAASNNNNNRSKKQKKKKSKSTKSSSALLNKKRFEICGFDISLLTKSQIQWVQYLTDQHKDENSNSKEISANPEDFTDLLINFDQTSFSKKLLDIVKSSVDELLLFLQDQHDRPTICLLEKKKCQRHSSWLKRIQDEHKIKLDRLNAVKNLLRSQQTSLKNAVCVEFWESMLSNKQRNPKITS